MSDILQTYTLNEETKETTTTYVNIDWTLILKSQL